MFIKKTIALALSLALAGAMLAGCQSNTPTASGSGSQASTGAADGEVVHIKLFTGKIETIDVMNEIIEDFNASQDRIVVEQEYQKDASNVIKIKFASNEVPDIMTTYEQGFVDEGKYMDLTDLNEFWDRMEQLQRAFDDQPVVDHRSRHSALAYALAFDDAVRGGEVHRPALFMGQTFELRTEQAHDIVARGDEVRIFGSGHRDSASELRGEPQHPGPFQPQSPDHAQPGFGFAGEPGQRPSVSGQQDLGQSLILDEQGQ